MSKLIKEQVFSTHEVKNREDLSRSIIWSDAKHIEDVKVGEKGYLHTILFDGLKPVNVTSVTKYNQ